MLTYLIPSVAVVEANGDVVMVATVVAHTFVAVAVRVTYWAVAAAFVAVVVAAVVAAFVVVWRGPNVDSVASAHPIRLDNISDLRRDT